MMVLRGERLDRTMSAYLVERIERQSLIDVRLHSQVTELPSDGRLDQAGRRRRAERVSRTAPPRPQLACVGFCRDTLA